MYYAQANHYPPDASVSDSLERATQCWISRLCSALGYWLHIYINIISFSLGEEVQAKVLTLLESVVSPALSAALASTIVLDIVVHVAWFRESLFALGTPAPLLSISR